MERQFMKGCEAIAEAALLAGCRFFAGYPITPQNEIPEYMSRRLPEVGGSFVQGESEVASVNMVYGAASAGARAMTSSSSPGVSLKSEGISYLAGARLPAVIVNVARGGPGVGTIQGAQADYLQATKASGNGGFRMIVFAPATVQEAVDLTYKAFDYADRDRNPVVVLADGFAGAMMEPVVLPAPQTSLPDKSSWITDGCEGRQFRTIVAGKWEVEDQEQLNIDAAKMYERWAKEDVQVEEYLVDDAEIIVTSYGTGARIARTAVNELREAGFKVGMIRPITVNPFPYGAFEKLDYNRVKAILNVEMSIPNQMVDDVKLGVKDRAPITCFGRSGGVVMRVDEVVDQVKKLLGKGGK